MKTTIIRTILFIFVATPFIVFAQNDDPNSASASSKNAIKSTGNSEISLVKEILQIMVDGNNAGINLRKFISPSYCSINDLDINSYKIDNYTPEDFEIKSFNQGSGYIIADIWGSNRGWVHELTFKVVNESGSLYVYPEKHSESYIKPWNSVRSYIEKESNKLSSSGYDEKQLVKEILQIMVDGNSANTKLRKYISPAYCTLNSIDINSYLVDNYSPVSFEIKSYNSSSGFVFAHIWGSSKSWIHELTFKIVKENGQLYVYPEKHSDTYVKPWYRTETNLEKKNSNNLSSSGYDEKKMVKEILQIMVDGNSANTKLRKYISPSYCSNNYIDINSYLVDNYTPANFEIKSYSASSGFVVANIWGNDKSWIHEITFKMVIENGQLYVYPETHSDTYVKPWFKRNTNIEDNVSNNLSSTGYEEKKMVGEILQIMVDGNSANTKLRKYISPSYCSNNYIDINSYLVDNYSPVNYEIKSYNSYSGLVIAHIWGSGKGWTQKLTFKMVKENGQLYVYPEKHSDTYVKPWYKTESYTETKTSNNLSSSGYEEKKVAREILQAMVDGSSTSTKLRPYISPSYCSQNNIDINSYLVDNYSPVDFEIKSYNSYTGLIIANIWGKNKGWVHELTFKIVKENGKLYVYPERHSDSYIKPWYSVRTSIGG